MSVFVLRYGAVSFYDRLDRQLSELTSAVNHDNNDFTFPGSIHCVPCVCRRNLLFHPMRPSLVDALATTVHSMILAFVVIRSAVIILALTGYQATSDLLETLESMIPTPCVLALSFVVVAVGLQVSPDMQIYFIY
ncbi:MAG: hypothetical protein V2I33_22930, partial [Kangiellaceae bacterium]|nr:hypothetical protein [Kangiellaceae bacterium]